MFTDISESGRTRILLVEDNPVEARLVGDMLKEAGLIHFELTHVTQIKDALEVLRERHFDVVLLDLTLPDSQGMQTFLKVHTEAPGLPILILSGAPDEELAMLSVREGAQDYLVKGQVDNKLLVRAIRYAIERKRVEEALLESEMRFRSLFEESKDAVFISTPEGRFVDMNRAGVELLGYSCKEDLLKVNIAQDLYFDPSRRNPYEQELRQRGFVKDFELVLRRKDGQKLHVLETSNAVLDKKGTLVAYRGIIRDVTHVKQLQQQLIQSQKIETIGRLAGGVAHDFNNILMAITSYCELIQLLKATQEPVLKYISEILMAAQKGTSLTRQLLAFSRKQILQPKVVNLNTVLSNMDNMLRRLIGEDIELSHRFDPNLGLIRVDPAQMEQVIMNLVVNARDAMPQGGNLSIETSNFKMDQLFVDVHLGSIAGDYVLITVTDNGEGMDSSTMLHVFEPFFTTKEKGKGTGLGLSTVYGIVKQSGGYITAYSETGHGTSFKIYLPRIIDAAEVQSSPSLGQPLSFGSETILVVDDNDSLRNAFSDMLKIRGYTVLEASDGTAALQMVQNYKDMIHLLITDVVMPRMNGHVLAERLQLNRPDLKVLYMSGYPGDAIQHHGILKQGTHFVQKPASMAVLFQKIREVLNSS